MERDKNGRFLKGNSKNRVNVNLKELEERYNSGQSMKQIAKEMGFGMNTIVRRLNKIGITKRRTVSYYNKVNGNSGQVKKGQRSIAWKGGTKIEFGYLYIWINDRYVRTHRYIVEKQLGRKLTRDEVVHHIDHNKTNNHLSNLKVMSKTDHARYHSKKKYDEKTSPLYKLNNSAR